MAARSASTRRAMSAVLERSPGHDRALSRFVAALEPDDIPGLLRLLALDRKDRKD